MWPGHRCPVRRLAVWTVTVSWRRADGLDAWAPFVTENRRQRAPLTVALDPFLTPYIPISRQIRTAVLKPNVELWDKEGGRRAPVRATRSFSYTLGRNSPFRRQDAQDAQDARARPGRAPRRGRIRARPAIPGGRDPSSMRREPAASLRRDLLSRQRDPSSLQRDPSSLRRDLLSLQRHPSSLRRDLSSPQRHPSSRRWPYAWPWPGRASPRRRGWPFGR